MLYYLQLYPCWKTMNCTACLHNSNQNESTKPCWQEEGTFCQVANMPNPCTDCQSADKEKRPETKESEREAENTRIK